MRPLAQRLIEQFITELTDGPNDSQSPLNGGQEKGPDPTQTGRDGKRELNIGDPVIISDKVQFGGKTGVVDDFGTNKHFVIVNLYNHGKHSFHESDVEYNDYADSEEEEEEDAHRHEIDNLRRLSGYGN